MSGKKGRSGRKPLPIECLKHKAIARAWNRVNWRLSTSEKVADDKKADEMATTLSAKDMVTKVSQAKPTKIIIVDETDGNDENK